MGGGSEQRCVEVGGFGMGGCRNGDVSEWKGVPRLVIASKASRLTTGIAQKLYQLYYFITDCCHCPITTTKFQWYMDIGEPLF